MSKPAERERVRIPPIGRSGYFNLCRYLSFSSSIVAVFSVQTERHTGRHAARFTRPASHMPVIVRSPAFPAYRCQCVYHVHNALVTLRTRVTGKRCIGRYLRCRGRVTLRQHAPDPLELFDPAPVCQKTIMPQAHEPRYAPQRIKGFMQSPGLCGEYG